MTGREHNVDVVERFFSGPRDPRSTEPAQRGLRVVERARGVPVGAGSDGVPGRDEIGALVLGRAPAPPLPTGRRVDRYDLSTAAFHDVVTLSDGPHVFRQHRYTARTRQGRDDENHYGFLFRFADDGLIERIWEHWGTLAAYRQLFQGPLVVHDPDELLMTTATVRRRLDLTRPVERALVEECLEVAVHAPSGSNQQGYRFVFVDDRERRDALADLYRQSMEEFVGRARTDAPEDTVDRSSDADRRMTASVEYLRDHFHEVPVLCVPLMAGRTDGDGAGAHAERTAAVWQAMRWGSVLPTVWSFLLALRSRGLGSAWTTLSVVKEREVAEVLGIPYDRWTQVGLFPIAHTIGTDFAVTPRRPATDVLRWNSYGGEPLDDSPAS